MTNLVTDQLVTDQYVTAAHQRESLDDLARHLGLRGHGRAAVLGQQCQHQRDSVGVEDEVAHAVVTRHHPQPADLVPCVWGDGDRSLEIRLAFSSQAL